MSIRERLPHTVAGAVGAAAAAIIASIVISHENTVSLAGAAAAAVLSWSACAELRLPARFGGVVIGVTVFYACWIGFFLMVLALGTPD